MLDADDPFWTIKRRVIEETGQFYYADKDDLLLERLRRRQTATRDVDLLAYLRRLSDSIAGPDEWRALEAEISIAETFFFRYADHFEALRTEILPDLLERNAETRQLRVWSAGCSTGAEAYSIAILLTEMLGARMADWHISILGTDLNNDVLQVARQGVYTAWALRSLSPDQRADWFTHADGRWTLKARFRGSVRFARSNLLQLLGPTPPLELTNYDLILCRNVLIYFHPDKVTDIARALVERLNPDGWLLVGHAEANPGFDRFAKAVLLREVVAYRPLGADDIPQPTTASAPAWAPEPLRPAAVAPPMPARRSVSPADAVQAPLAPAAIDQIRALADAGNLPAAGELCRQALAQGPEEPALHYYAGLIHHALGQLAPAEDAFRRAAYLDPDFIMAHYHLGLARLDQGKAAAGRREIRTAAVLAGTQALDRHLPHGAGLTVEDLKDLARLHLEGRAPGGAA
jgi:chemotaxis protein methyltransferase CheR